MILKEFKEHAIELIGAVLLKWKYEPNKASWESVTREDLIADATRLMEESLIGWDMTSDHVSKSELRAWCEGVIQKEVIEGRKSLRRSSDEDIEEIGHLDGMKEVLYRILNRFCKGEES